MEDGVKKDKSDKGKSLKDLIAKQQDRLKQEKENEENKPDWLKQIDSMKPNEDDIIKSDQKKRGRESRKERIKKRDDKYNRLKQIDDEKAWKKKWDEMGETKQQEYIRDHPKSKEAEEDKKKRK